VERKNPQHATDRSQYQLNEHISAPAGLIFSKTILFDEFCMAGWRAASSAEPLHAEEENVHPHSTTKNIWSITCALHLPLLPTHYIFYFDIFCSTDLSSASLKALEAAKICVGEPASIYTLSIDRT